MMASTKSRLFALLCLALVFLIGVTPTQGIVVCVEADGCVSVELKSSDGGCGGCEGHVDGSEAEERDAAASDTTECPCVDLAVFETTSEPLVRLASAWDLQVGAWSPPGPELRLESVAIDVRAARAPPPRLPSSAAPLTHLRSVVLHV